MSTSLIDRLMGSAEDKRLLERETAILEVTDLICRLMEERQVTKTELARRLQTSKANVTQLLDGRRNMTICTLADVLFHLGYSFRAQAVLLSGTKGASRRGARQPKPAGSGKPRTAV